METRVNCRVNALHLEESKLQEARRGPRERVQRSGSDSAAITTTQTHLEPAERRSSGVGRGDYAHTCASYESVRLKYLWHGIHT
ncbi:hypothetical protein NDU88_000918 [Pleurodeles waltl]|uniref:Uncharacterized protein n=1 Tax=Pleurodeles waltl TaxID=8319 RepID=A0AAV7WKE2_PLEWA|nr:hypothetical protein NDU88_000918 [Pleurodeles waltl]